MKKSARYSFVDMFVSKSAQKGVTDQPFSISWQSFLVIFQPFSVAKRRKTVRYHFFSATISHRFWLKLLNARLANDILFLLCVSSKIFNCLIQSIFMDTFSSLDLNSVIDVLQKHLNHEAVQTRVSVLKWIYHLHQKMPNKVYKFS